MSRAEPKPVDYPFLALVAGLVGFGLFVLTSASAPSGIDRFGDGYYFLKHQLIFGLLPGLAGLVVFSRIPYQFWKKHAWNLLLISIGLLVLVFIPGLSAGIGTAHSWVQVGPWFSFQPSEFVKLTFLFYLAGWLEARGSHGMRDAHTGLVPFIGVLGAIAALMMLQPDLGTMSIIVAMALTVYYAGGAPLAYVFGLIASGILALGMLIGLAPYRAARFMTFLNPEMDPQGVGYHINQALLAIGSGGMFGVGYGLSRQKFQYLPEVVGDSIFAIIGEELGFIACVLLIGAFFALLVRAFKIGNAAPDRFGKSLAIGVGAWLTIQALVNIASMVALLPMTGVPLPFISYGGTSLAVNLWAVGVVLNVSRYANLSRD